MGTKPCAARSTGTPARRLAIGLLVLFGLGCAQAGLRVSVPVDGLPRDGPYVHVARVADTRRFVTASNRAPIPSLRGDPNDAALSERMVGRRLIE